MKFLRHLAGYTPVSIASGLAAFGGVFLFTRLLEAEEYGRYALMFSVLTLVHTMSLVPAEAAAYRYAGQAQARSELPDHFRTALSLTFRSLIVTTVLFAALAIVLRHQPDYLAILPWLLVITVMSTIIQVALESHKAMQNVSRYSLLQTFLTLSGFLFGALVAWQTGLGAVSPFVGLALAAAIVFIPEAAWLRAQAKGGTVSPERRKLYLAYGLPIAAALVLDIIVSVADRFLIAIFLGEAAVGEYAAGYGVADKTVLLICSWAAIAGSPLIMAAYESGGKDAARKEARGLISTLLLLGVPAAAGIAMVATPLAEVLIGAEVRVGATQIIPWIAFAGLLNGLLMHYFSEVFQLAHKTLRLTTLMLIPASLNIGLNLILIPTYGLMGAVYATLISYGVGVLIVGLVGRQYVALPLPLGDLARITAAAACMWPVIQLIPAWGGWLELLGKVIAGGLVYVTIALLLDAGGARQFLRNRGQG
ncbi:MAG: polysaccharide biosynthesis C-terminal domain-containing protein [Henriciella sp.]|nr:polysaccharide biosynthesis C-terminal domain-containing protein [Henriciella sp.]